MSQQAVALSEARGAIGYAYERGPLDYIQIGERFSPGVISPGGIQGFKREIGWDIKRGKGASAATLTRKDIPPGEGSISFRFWTDEQILEWETVFYPILKGNPSAKDADAAVIIYHPRLASVGMAQFVLKSAAPVLHVGSGVHETTIELIEWRPVPAKSIVATPASAKGDATSAAGTPPDTVADADQKAIADLVKQAFP